MAATPLPKQISLKRNQLRVISSNPEQHLAEMALRKFTILSPDVSNVSKQQMQLDHFRRCFD